MKPITRTFAAAAGVAFVAACAAALGAGVAAQRAAPAAVAVIDIDRISAEMEEFKVPTQNFQTKQNAKRDELLALQTRMQSIAEEIELIPESDPDARIVKNTQLVVLDSEFKTKQQIFQNTVDRDRAILFKSMFDRIETGAATLAARDGIDIMLIDDRVFTLAAENLAAQNAALESKKVLFANDTIDLTDELLTLLNNEFNAGK
jgi:Skp family chaperone for outer membrane proteins